MKYHILWRSPGNVREQWEGSLARAAEEVARRNATDDDGTTELYASFSSVEELEKEWDRIER